MISQNICPHGECTRVCVIVVVVVGGGGKLVIYVDKYLKFQVSKM